MTKRKSETQCEEGKCREVFVIHFMGQRLCEKHHIARLKELGFE